MSRKRGRIVLIGVTGLELSRADFYEKELTFQVSCSYGPGRYDPSYEEGGQDYPFGFVRWTEQRNLEAVLDMMADGRLDAAPLVSHRFAIGDAPAAYAVVGGREPSLGILLEYPAPTLVPSTALMARTLPVPASSSQRTCVGAPVVSFIGAGSYASRVLMPAFKAAGASFKQVATASGLGAALAGSRFGFHAATTDSEAVLADPDVEAVVIATRHDSHAKYVVAALEAGKHVFVEKPLCLTLEELSRIEAALLARTKSGPSPILMVGFNRRYSPHGVQLRRLLARRAEPKSFVMTVNAGLVPPQHWSQNPEAGGGRIIGEACHFVDLLRYLAGAPIMECRSFGLATAMSDSATLQLAFADGSIGTIHYLANGHRAVAKERLEVFCGGSVLQLDNFRKLKAFGWPGFTGLNLWSQYKGQKACAAAFVRALRGDATATIPIDETLEVALASIRLAGDRLEQAG